MRSAFSNALLKLAGEDAGVLLLTGDHGYSLFDAFRKQYPRQYINAGVAEQNMVGMAAGLAKAGFRPFVYGLSAFVPIRVMEQIKLDIAHDKLPVVLIGDGAGFVYSQLGSSHQSTEDIACARAVPELAVLSPGDRHELIRCMEYAYRLARPAYLRIGKADRGDVHVGELPALDGGLLSVRPGEQGGISLIATGSLVSTAMRLAVENYFEAAVWSVPVIKPIDAEQVAAIARRSRAIVTLEEHSIYGGLGSLIAELVTSYAPCRVLRIGVEDRFSDRCGSYEYLLSEHSLDFESIRQRIDRFLSDL